MEGSRNICDGLRVVEFGEQVPAVPEKQRPPQNEGRDVGGREHPDGKEEAD